MKCALTLTAMQSEYLYLYLYLYLSAVGRCIWWAVQRDTPRRRLYAPKVLTQPLYPPLCHLLSKPFLIQPFVPLSDLDLIFRFHSGGLNSPPSIRPVWSPKKFLFLLASPPLLLALGKTSNPLFIRLSVAADCPVMSVVFVRWQIKIQRQISWVGWSTLFLYPPLARCPSLN